MEKTTSLPPWSTRALALWRASKNVTALHGMLQWIGWWKTMIAFIVGIAAWLWSHLGALPGPLQFLAGLGTFLVLECAFLVGLIVQGKAEDRAEKRASRENRPQVSLLSVKMFSEFPQNVYRFGILLVELVLKNEGTAPALVQFGRWDEPAILSETAIAVEFIEFLGFFSGNVTDGGRRHYGSDDRVVNPQEVFKVIIEVKQSIKRWQVEEPQPIGALMLRVDHDEMAFQLAHKPIYQRFN